MHETKEEKKDGYEEDLEINLSKKGDEYVKSKKQKVRA